MFSKNMIIAIEGPTGAGKTTVARELASRYGFRYFNTGTLFRGLAAASILEGVNTAEELESFVEEADFSLDVSSLNPLVSIEGVDVSSILQDPHTTRRSTLVGGMAVAMSRFDAVTQQIVDTSSEVVVEGKGLSTGLARMAEHKFYLTAPRPVRAFRKFQQAYGSGKTDYTLIRAFADVQAGDLRDLGNAGGLLNYAPNTTVINTGSLEVEQVVAVIHNHIHRSTPDTLEL